MVHIYEVQFGKMCGSHEGLKGRTDTRQRLFVLNGDFIEAVIQGRRILSFLETKRPAATGEEDSLMIPATKESWIGFYIISLSARGK